MNFGTPLTPPKLCSFSTEKNHILVLIYLYHKNQVKRLWHYYRGRTGPRNAGGYPLGVPVFRLRIDLSFNLVPKFFEKVEKKSNNCQPRRDDTAKT